MRKRTGQAKMLCGRIVEERKSLSRHAIRDRFQNVPHDGAKAPTAQFENGQLTFGWTRREGMERKVISNPIVSFGAECADRETHRDSKSILLRATEVACVLKSSRFRICDRKDGK